MILTTIKRIIKSGWKSFWRNNGLAVATIFIIVMIISLINGLFIFQAATDFLVSNLQEKADVSIYFNENISEAEILEVKKEINAVEGVNSIEYISREMASEKFVEKYKESQILMEALEIVEDDPFLASLNVKMAEASDYAVLNGFLEEKFSEKIYKINYFENKEVIESIFSISSDVKRFTFVFSLFLAVLGILVAFNTIRLTIYTLKEEIEIQRLVGASNWFIRGPFVVQGIIAGIFATMISLLIFIVSFYFLNPQLKNLFLGFDFFGYFVNNFLFILLIGLVCGISIGVISSLIAMRKYLKI
ncbi:ABC transporter permease [Candidatus Parcubacteria bacterium]|nr:ABC transporter permease [Candidatus Parcubacteria bacterium]